MFGGYDNPPEILRGACPAQEVFEEKQQDVYSRGSGPDNEVGSDS